MLAAVLAGALVSCKTVDDPASRKPEPGPGVIARLQSSGGSAVTGAARFRQNEGGVTMVVDLRTGGPGQWQIVIHANGNCASPNAFSAGSPLMLSGSSRLAAVQITTGSEGGGNATARLPGIVVDGPAGINGKSVVVHAGAVGSLEAQPGVPNNRVACGVIETDRPLF